MAEMVNSSGHCSADELVHQRSPGIGRMTFYRILALFCRLGLVRPFDTGGGAAHYALMESGHHHHLICSSCGQIIKIEDCVLERITLEYISKRFDFDVQGHLLELYGLCGQCIS